MGKKKLSKKLKFVSGDGGEALLYIRIIKNIAKARNANDSLETLYEKVSEISAFCDAAKKELADELFLQARNKGEFVEINPGDKIDGIPF